MQGEMAEKRELPCNGVRREENKMETRNTHSAFYAVNSCLQKYSRALNLKFEAVASQMT